MCIFHRHGRLIVNFVLIHGKWGRGLLLHKEKIIKWTSFLMREDFTNLIILYSDQLGVYSISCAHTPICINTFIIWSPCRDQKYSPTYSYAWVRVCVCRRTCVYVGCMCVCVHMHVCLPVFSPMLRLQVYTTMPSIVFDLGSLGIELRSSRLYKNCFPHWASPPAILLIVHSTPQSGILNLHELPIPVQSPKDVSGGTRITAPLTGMGCVQSTRL